MSVELMIYGVVAAGLVVWLRSVLGTRHGEERSRANPYIRSVTEENSEAGSRGDTNGDFASARANAAHEAIQDLAENPTETLSIAPESVDGLLDVAKADKSFEVHDFLNKVQDAYAIAIEAFAEGDVETLAVLLDEPVFEAFNEAIAQRHERGEQMESSVHAVRSAAVQKARMKGKVAYVTVAFTAEGTTVIKDSDDNITSGSHSRAEEMKDTWVFKRDTKSSDPRWLLAETK